MLITKIFKQWFLEFFMLFFAYLIHFIKNCYKNNFWTEKSEKPLKEVTKNYIQVLNFTEMYWLEISRKIYIFSCLLNSDADQLTCLLVKPKGLSLDTIDSPFEERLGNFFNYPNLFFKIAFFQLYNNAYNYYNLATTVNEGVLKGSLNVFSGRLQTRLNQTLNSFKNWRFLLKNFNWFVEKRFDILKSHNTYYAVNLEYVTIRYSAKSEDAFRRSMLIGAETFGFQQFSYLNSEQMDWFFDLDELKLCKELTKDNHFCSSLLQVLFETDKIQPVFKLRDTIIEPIKEKDELAKLTFIRTNTYLVLDKQTQTLRWRVTLPAFRNNLDSRKRNILVFMVLTSLEQAESGYKEVALEMATLEADSICSKTAHGKFHYNIFIKKEKDELSIRMLSFGERLDGSNLVWNDVKQEKSEDENSDERFFHTEFIKHFNGVVISVSELQPVIITSSDDSNNAKNFSNTIVDRKVVLLIFLGFIGIAILAFEVLRT